MNNSITDVIIHTRDSLTGYQFNEVSKNVYLNEGIISFSRNTKTPQCLMVVYNSGKTKASSILDTVRNLGIKASLVGI
jgi:hypothetical protein